LGKFETALTLFDTVHPAGHPPHIRSDNGPEFVAKAVQDWIAVAGAKTAYIERGSPWENGYIESFNARLRDELLNGEIFNTLREAQIVTESWRRHCNTIRPHASIGYKPSAPEVFVPAFAAWPAALRKPAPPAHAGATANLKLSFHLDHTAGADHYRARDPLLGASGDGGSPWCILEDALIADGFAQSILLCPLSVGGATVGEWAPGGTYHHRMIY